MTYNMADSEEKQFDNFKIKNSLIFSVRKESLGYQYILEDTHSEKYFRLGEREYSFIIQLDGVTTLGNALNNVNLEHTNEPLNKEQATEIINWLIKENLLEQSGTVEKLSVANPEYQNTLERWIKKINIIFLRVPLLNPDRFLDRLLPKLSWLVTKPFILIWASIILSGIYHITSQWSRFENASLGVFYPLNWLWLIAGYIFIKTSHEIFHGLVNKYYGGVVNEAGVIFVLFIPIGYVNATSSWHFANKWQRFHTAIAGMFIELLFAGIACWIWAYSEPGPLNNFAYNMIVIASVSTLLFNANPLMRFDGYFAISDLLNIPNLYARGRQYTQYLLRRYILGQKITYPDQFSRKSSIIKIYGIASTVWRLFILVFILVAAYSLFYGAGILLACIALAGMVLPPSTRLYKKLTETNLSKSSWISVTFRVTCIAMVSGIIFTQLSWSKDIIAPGVIDFVSTGRVHTKINGFINTVNVKQGDFVKSGQVLAKLENKELETDLAVLKNQLAHSKTAARIYLHHDQLAEYKIENENILAYQKQLKLKQQQVDNLIIRAPVEGTIVTDQLQNKLGQYAETGDTVEYVGNPNEKRIYISVLQKDQYDNDKLSKRPVKVRVNNSDNSKFQVKIFQKTPRAYKRVSFPQLSATNGGPLTVVPITPHQNDSNRNNEGFEYLEPRVELSAAILPSDAHHVYAGQVAWVRLPSLERPLGSHLFGLFSNWITYLFERERW